jgi:hypothetical protein
MSFLIGSGQDRSMGTSTDRDRIMNLEVTLEKARKDMDKLVIRCDQISRAWDDAEFKCEAAEREKIKVEKKIARLVAQSKIDKNCYEAKLERDKANRRAVVTALQKVLDRQKLDHEKTVIELGVILDTLGADTPITPAEKTSLSSGGVFSPGQFVAQEGLRVQDPKYHADPRAFVKVSLQRYPCPIMIGFTYHGRMIVFPFLTPPFQNITIFSVLNTALQIAAQLNHLPAGTNMLNYLGIWKFTWTSKHPSYDVFVRFEHMICANGNAQQQEMLLQQWLAACPWGTFVQAHQRAV